jgi:2-desacetyl-2-hydroxyethyl bacteriochlorophyllide A dehydrogenase
MKAAVFRKYGPPDVLTIEDVEKPAPRDDEVLVRVHATTVCTPDWRFRSAKPSFFIRPMIGLRRPAKKFNILGLEFAGQVEQVGAKVSRFAVGDRVFGSTGFKMGAHAQYVCVPEHRGLAKTPDTVTDEQAAAIPFGGISALHFLRLAKVAAGQKVLIYGASGSVGTYAVQLAKHFGAHVTAVCSTANLDLVRSLGADHAIDYTKEDFSSDGRIYDVVFDAVGKTHARQSVRPLKRGGFYVLVGANLSAILGGIWLKLSGAGRSIGGMARAQPGDLDLLGGLVAAGKVSPVIGRRFALDEITEAHRYAESGHKRGNAVVITEEK